MGRRKLELVSNYSNRSSLTEAETLNTPGQSTQIDWSLYPELYQAKLRRVRRAIDALVAKSRGFCAARSRLLRLSYWKDCKAKLGC